MIRSRIGQQHTPTKLMEKKNTGPNPKHSNTNTEHTVLNFKLQK